VVNVLKSALVVTCAVALAGCGPGKGGGGLPESIDGAYSITAMNYFGEIRLPDEVQKMGPAARKVIFADGKMTTHMHGSPQTCDITIDRTSSPAQVVFTRTNKEGKTETTYGVMAILGGYLTVCQRIDKDLKPEDRPTEIKNGEKYLTIKLKKES
jgi:uncharacterized protein (TIGR03067 family)